MSIPVIIHEFSLTRDFRKIKWGATIWYNLLRSMSAGLVLGILMLIFPQQQGDQAAAFAGPIVWPFAYLFFFLPFGMILSLTARFVPFVNIFTLFMALIAVTLGDPIVCVIHRLFPRFVPVAEPSLFSFDLTQWVLDTNTVISVATTRNIIS